MTSADFCTLSITSRQWLLLSEHSVQTSLGTTRFFPSIYLPHLLYTIPCSYRASSCVADLPSCTAFYTVSVRQTRGLPMGSFPTSGFLQICSHLQHPCLRLYPSRYQVDSGLSPVRNVRRQAHLQKRLSGTVPGRRVKSWALCVLSAALLIFLAASARTKIIWIDLLSADAVFYDWHRRSYNL